MPLMSIPFQYEFEATIQINHVGWRSLYILYKPEIYYSKQLIQISRK
jgi:hypothetical protein